MSLSLITLLGYIFHWVLALTIAFFIIMDHRRPAEVNVLWLFIILFVPYVGMIIYFILGVNLKRWTIFKVLAEDRLKKRYERKLQDQKVWLNQLVKKGSQESISAIQNKVHPLERSLSLIAHDSDCTKTVRLLFDTCGSPLFTNTSIQLYFKGIEAYEVLLKDLSQAKKSIDMEFYIWRSDETGEKILEILKERASNGVQVRLIFDSIGCLGKISSSYRRQLKKANIQFHYFLDPLSYVGHRQINFRSHRKIVVIDERICYTGGMNIGNEYRLPQPKKWYKEWRDTFVRMEGDSAAAMEDIFEIDWQNSDSNAVKGKSFPQTEEEEKTNLDSYFSAQNSQHKLAQLICSGPDSTFDSIEFLYSSLISNANKYVCIQSPYFIPSDNVLKTLQIAALSGVKIQIITTGVSDKVVPFKVAETYFDELTSCGIEIYRYEKGFYHTKMVLIDGKMATVGSCNFDIRSFRLDYEINIVLYDEESIDELQRQFQEDIKNSYAVEKDYFKKMSWLGRFFRSILRMISPLL